MIQKIKSIIKEEVLRSENLTPIMVRLFLSISIVLNIFSGFKVY